MEYIRITKDKAGQWIGGKQYGINERVSGFRIRAAVGT